jgi:hypothetical protein
MLYFQQVSLGKNHVGDGVNNKRATEITRQVFKENDGPTALTCISQMIIL